MKLYSQNEHYKLYNGNMLDLLEVIGEETIDAVLTDPPYELNFMNKNWDNTGIAFQKETWEKCLKVLKPGGYLLAFGGTRTFHRIACAIEDAGFEIRDTIMWLYGSGFPKSMNVGLAVDKKNGIKGKKYIDKDFLKRNPNTGQVENGIINKGHKDGIEGAIRYKCTNEWQGWGTALKPSFEPIIVARKPFKGSLVDNVIKYGVGGINIDECRVELESDYQYKETNRKSRQENNVFDNNTCGFDSTNNHTASANINGRFPANTILTYDDNDFEEVCGNMPYTNGTETKEKGTYGFCFDSGKRDNKPMADGYNDEGSASRYFKNCPYTKDDFYDVPQRYYYCGKATKEDRDEGLEQFDCKPYAVSNQAIAELKRGNLEKVEDRSQMNSVQFRKNTHPTVKPCDLMRYLVRLVAPKGSTILDCFMGSGSTGKAVMFENKERNKDYKFIGVELSEEYLEIASARIDYAINLRDIFVKKSNNKKQTDKMQMSIFDLIENKE